MPISDIIATVGFDKKQIPLPTKGPALLLNIMKSCLSLEKEERPSFKEILNQLQQRNKGVLNVPKKSN
jgi:Protein tyrosine kinase.